MFLIVLLILTTVEELIVGSIHARAIADSLNGHLLRPVVVPPRQPPGGLR